MKPKALYGGSFDPVTRGHIDVILKAAKIFDLHVGIGSNPAKKRLFTVEESLLLIDEALREHNNPCTLGDFTGKGLVSYAREIGATHIVRGLRQISDFNDEFTLHGVVEKIDPSITMVHFICDHEYLHVSSSTARQLAAIGEGLDWVVTPNVAKALRLKF